jgi:8-oxo-dGTP pyrophosphatase MutT (NUDIX family)
MSSQVPSHSLDVLTTLAPAVTATVAEMAERWMSGSTPVEPRVSASVVLCRDGSDGLETYLLHRHARMAFAASMVVFPGGGVDAVDGSGPSATEDRLLACAIRETREETGVELAADDLVPWAHWITPAIQPIRYDTFFYLAALPPDQAADDVSTETERAEWTRPVEAVAGCEAGTLAMMPPTLSILIELAGVSSLAEVIELGRDRVVETVLPEVVRAGDGAGGWIFRYPTPTPSAR